MRYLLLILFVTCVEAGLFKCSSHTDCSQCTSDFLCKWCPSEGCILNVKQCANETAIKDSSKCNDKPVAAYDENMARHTLWPLIGATKANISSIEFQSCKSRAACDTFHVTRINVTINTLKEYSSADIYVIPSRKQIITIVHGSTGVLQILHLGLELEMVAVAATVPKMEGFALHYFAGAFENLWKKGLKSALQGIVFKYPGFEMWCSGHSLGGPVAALVAAQVSMEGMVPSEKLRLVTFGGPRLGTEMFNKDLIKLVPYRFRVVNRMDPIANLPKKFFNTDIYLQHFKYEVWYPSGMQANSQWITCLEEEDPACKPDTSDTDSVTEDHTTYFGVPIDTWWQSGCQY